MTAYLAAYGKDRVYYCPNPGNAGDSLVTWATIQLFRRLGVRFSCVDPEDLDVRGKVVFYGGGGNLVPLYDDARRFVERCHTQAKKLVVLPHTIRGNDDLLARLGPNVDVICRERVSYDQVVERVRGARVLLSDDMALHLDAQAILSVPYWKFLLPGFVRTARDRLLRRQDRTWSPWRTVLRAKETFEAAGLSIGSVGRGERGDLHCFRTDIERTAEALSDDNCDLSEIFLTIAIPLWRTKFSAWCVLRYLSHYRAIRTNRAHLAIAGALLKKEVFLSANSYCKNRAIYDASLRHRFPNVHWI